MYNFSLWSFPRDFFEFAVRYAKSIKSAIWIKCKNLCQVHSLPAKKCDRRLILNYNFSECSFSVSAGNCVFKFDETAFSNDDYTNGFVWEPYYIKYFINARYVWCKLFYTKQPGRRKYNGLKISTAFKDLPILQK